MKISNQKLQKVAELARRGIGGERESAKTMLKKLCDKHGHDYEKVLNGDSLDAMLDTIIDRAKQNNKEESNKPTSKRDNQWHDFAKNFGQDKEAWHRPTTEGAEGGGEWDANKAYKNYKEWERSKSMFN